MATFQESELSPTKRARRVALACIPCRSRKVRCDATQPTCNRCRVDEKECEYQKSRRGGRPRKRTLVTAIPVAQEHCSLQDAFSWIGTVESSTDEFCRHALATDSTGTGTTGESQRARTEPTMSIPNGTHLTETQVDQLLGQYYANFHSAHPCVLPRWSLETHMAIEPAICEFLLPVLLYIGSVFTHCIESQPLADAAARAIESGRHHAGSPNPYFAQALTLYSIAVYWCNEPQKGRKLLDESIDAAFALGMHLKEFASQYGHGDAVLEESWRRTWWQMHITDIHISGSTHTYEGISAKYPSTAELPCEELQYDTGDIPIKPNTLEQYDTREFRDLEFSSFAQLIGFTQGLTRVLSTTRPDDLQQAQNLCANADTMMTAWCSLLPASKKTLLRPDGSVDEILFKAMILMQTCLVELHRRLSSLLYSPIESASQCAPPPPPSANSTLKAEAQMHTAKILAATESLNTLLTLPTRFTTHTPFTICMIANMTIAHLSACRYVFREPRLSVERDRIRLNMGVLKVLGEFWPAGLREYKAVGVIARTILGLREEDAGTPSEANVSLDDVVGFDFGLGGGEDGLWACNGGLGDGHSSLFVGEEGLLG